MGITPQGLDFLLSARDHGVSFARTVTIGRQFLLAEPEVLAERLGPSAAVVADGSGFADRLFECLGATEMSSLDASDFEGATFVHDLNLPIPAELKARFSAVIDGGSLEHVFDFPTAIRNAMEMVAPGGHFLGISPTNNAAGHGFYQFSPDLFFRILCPANGFCMQRMLLVEVHPGATWYRVIDPGIEGVQAQFGTRREAYLYIQARRIGDVVPLRDRPVQSNYRAQWSGVARQGSSQGTGPLEPLKAALRRRPVIAVPAQWAAGTWRSYRAWRQPLDPRYFQPIGTDLLRAR